MCHVKFKIIKQIYIKFEHFKMFDCEKILNIVSKNCFMEVVLSFYFNMSL